VNIPPLSNATLFILLMEAMFLLLDGLLFDNFRAPLYAAAASSVGVYLYASSLRNSLRTELLVTGSFIAVAMPILAWSTPNVWLLYLLMCIWVPLVAGRFERLVPIYLFSLLLLPSLDMTMAVGGLKLFEFGVLDALAVGTAVAVALSPKKSSAMPRSDAWVCATLLMLGAALSRDTSFSNFLRTFLNVALDLGLPYYLVSRGIRNLEDLRIAVRWFAGAGMALAPLLMLEAWKAWPIYNELYAELGVPLVLMVKARGGMLRAGGPLVEPTSIALVMALCLVALYLLREDFRSRLHHGLLLVAVFIGLSIPQSRGAWIGLFVALVTADLFRRRYALLFRKGVLVTTLAGTVFMLAQLSPSLSETVGLSGGSSETSEYRRRLLTRGMEEFWQSPLIGFSLPQLNVRLADLVQGEGIIDFVNTYIWIALISGTVGLVAFIGTFLHFLSGVWRFARHSGDPAAVELAAFPFACSVMLLEMFFFTSFGNRPAFLTFALFGLSAALVAKRADRAGESRAGALSPPGTGLPRPPSDEQWGERQVRAEATSEAQRARSHK